MGGFDFEWKGKLYVINTEGGCPFFESDEEEKAFEEWRVTKEGIQLFGPVPTDWSKEHYLDDRYPWDPNRDCRVDVENIDCDPDDDSYYDEPYIDWASYDKCRFNCYRHFYITNKAHECAKCGVMACKECARDCFKDCSGEGCNEKVCGCDCEYCDCCEEEMKNQGNVDDDDRFRELEHRVEMLSEALKGVVEIAAQLKSDITSNKETDGKVEIQRFCDSIMRLKIE